MDTQPLKLQVDSKEARADLDALAKALDTAGNAVGRMEQKFASGMSGVDRALKTSMSSMEKFAQVSALIGKIKLSADPANHLRDFANALNALSRAKAIDPGQITQIKKLTATLAELKVPTGAARMTQFLNAVGAAKAPSQSSIQRLNEFFKILGNYKSSGATRNTAALESFFRTVSNIKVPSEASLKRLSQMFVVLSEAKAIPGAGKIAHDLDTIAAAAGRAGAALNTMPRSIRGLSPAYDSARKSASGLHDEVQRMPGHADKAGRAISGLGAGLNVLGDRFKLSYQLGTVFSAMFSAFTVGQFVKNLYEANVELLKLQKAMLFQTGTMEEAHKATDEFIAITDRLGLNLRTSMEAYGRFAISAKASGIDLKQTNDVFRSVGTALQVVGADSHQTTLAFYSLTEMLQKGTVHSKEFNRQLGQQIPGNAALGAQALSKLENRFISVAEFFQRMQRGQIMSNTFVPVYAKIVEDTYKPLLGLVKLRPDAAFNSLRTAFVLFAREAGNAGFMGALSRGLQDLHDKIIYVDKDGVEHLTPHLANLAKTLGQNLASMVHAATTAMSFLADHIDGVVMSLKAMLALKVAATFVSWGSGAAKYAGSLGGVKKETEAVAAATVATQAVHAAGGTAATEQAAIGALGSSYATRDIINRRAAGGFRTTTARGGLGSWFTNAFGAVVGGLGAGAQKPPIYPGMHSASEYSDAFRTVTPEGAASMAQGSRARFIDTMRARMRPNANFFQEVEVGADGAAVLGGVGGFGRRAGGAARRAAAASRGGLRDVAANGLGLGVFTKVGDAAKSAGVGIMSFAKNMTSVSAVGKTLTGALGSMIPLLSMGFVGAAVAATVALAAFGDHETSVGGKTVRFNDIVGGGFKVLGNVIGKWWETSGSHIGMFGHTLGELGKNAGEIVTNIVTSFVWMAEVIGKIVASMAEQIAHPFKALFTAFDALKSGNMKGAVAALGDAVVSGITTLNPIGFGVRLGATAVDAAKNTSFTEVRKQVTDAAVGSAADRAASAKGDMQQEAVYRNAEEQLAITQKQQQDEQNRGEIEQLNRRLTMGDTSIPTLEDLLKDISETASNQAAATKATADAANSTANAAQKAATGASTTPAAPAAIAAAIHKAATATGVDESLLTRIAFKESSFNPNARPRDKNGNIVGTAGGLFQFTDATAKQLDLQDRFDPEQASVSAARLAKINGAFLQAHLGREATGGEVYAAHFLGAAGATSIAKMASEKPDTVAANVFGDAAAANPDVFYANGKNKTGALSVKSGHGQAERRRRRTDGPFGQAAHRRFADRRRNADDQVRHRDRQLPEDDRPAQSRPGGEVAA
jgi:tape measure domain-containing protein